MLSSSQRSDFGDWLSPMLVKELRQGMRSRIFVAAFYVTQVLMILSTIFSLLAASEPESAPGNMVSFLNWLFWLMIGVPLLFFMPLLGFGALHSEMKARTLELVFLTRLSAWRIVFGKWAALMAETLLLVCSILPYVILRYFLGGVDILEDLQGLFFLLIGSALLTATTLAMSPYESKLLRALFVLGLIFVFQSSIGVLLAWIAFSASGASSGSVIRLWQVYLILLAFVPAYLLLALEIAASRIAPPAENHAVRKRLIGVYLLVIVPLLTWVVPSAQGLHFVSLVLLAVVIVDGLAEPIENLRAVRRPFADLGPAGRSLALFFSPGWASASWYFLLVAGLGGVMLYSQSRLDDDIELLDYVCYLGTLIFPAALIRLFQPSTRYFLGFYVVIHVLLVAVTFFVGMLSGISGEPLTNWLSPIPTSVFILRLTDQITAHQAGEFLRFTGLVTAGSLGILLLRAMPWVRGNAQSVRTAP